MTREIIALVERRRKWPAEDKLRIMSEALSPGASASEVSDRNGTCRSLLYTWLRLARVGGPPGISLAAPKVLPKSLATASFLPVAVGSAPSPPPTEAPALRSANPSTACAPASARRRTASVEVVLDNGRTLETDESIDPAVLARLAVNTGCRDAEICGLRRDWEVKVPELGTSVFIVPSKRLKN